MTDSFSEENPLAEMAAELMQAKMDVRKAQQTHLLRIGTFQVEISPDTDMDVREFFNETLDKLIRAYGDKLLEIDIKTAMQTAGSMHG